MVDASLGHGYPEAETAFRPGLISLYGAKLRLQPEVVLAAPSASPPGTGNTQVILGQFRLPEMSWRLKVIPACFKEEVMARNATLWKTIIFHLASRSKTENHEHGDS